MNEETFNKFVKQVQDEMEALEDKPTIGEIRDVSDLPLIVYPTTGTTTRITVEAEKTCRTCRHWLGDPWINGGIEWKHCRLPELYHNGRETILGARRARKHTAFNHSCAGYQPRPDADARE